MWLIPIGVAIALVMALSGRRGRVVAPPPAAPSVPPTEAPPTTDAEVPVVAPAEIEAAITEETRAAPATASPLASPLAGVTDAQWSHLVQWARQGKVNTISAAGNLGLYLLGVPVLVDFGLMRNPRQVPRADGKGKGWEADWIPPHSRAAFFADPQLQYAVWKKHVVRLAAWIQAKHAGAIGAVTAGKPASLSGLLAVALMAGPSGLAAWLAESPAQRHASTTAAYTAVNGIF